MMLDSTSRWVYIFDFCLIPSPPESPDVSMKEAARKLKTLFLHGEPVHMTRKDSVATRISDIKLVESGDNPALEMLIQYADKRASDPVFANLDSGELREEPKLEGEGIAVSAHFVVSLDSTFPGGNQYVAVLEEVPAVTRSHLKPFLTKMLRDAFADAEFIDPMTGKRKSCRPVMDLESHPDQTLEELLEGRKISSISLKNYSPKNEMDEDPYVKEVESSLVFKVKKEPKNRADFLNSFKEKWSKKGFSDMRISYKDLHGSGKKSQGTVKLEKKQDAATALFTRQEKIQLSDEVKQCSKELQTEICGKMKTIMVSTKLAIKAKKQ